MTTRLDLAGVLMDLGVEVTTENDQRVFGLCPGHEEYRGRKDSKPSWSMDKELLVHHCWSCPYAGTLRQLIADQRGDTEEASEWLADYTRRRAIQRLRHPRKVAEAPKPVPKPLTALQRRLESFSDPPDWALEARGLERFAVVHYGLRWDADVDHWVIPIHDEYGKLAGFQRKADGYFKNVPKGMEKKYMVFGLAQLTGTWGILVESPLDVVRLYSEGVEGGVSSFGAWASNHQLDLILERVEDLVLALDNDDAGNEQRNRIWHAQWRIGNRLRCLDYTGTHGKDIGEMTSAEVRRHALYPLLWRPPEPPPRYRPREKWPPGQRFLEWREARRLEAQC
jgi:hypothetical protein